ncbi:hypothetical protein C5167_016575 [Papaver somniferum]|nr:hypothetical protein C5167_016575 [Papaver somniferum]
MAKDLMLTVLKTGTTAKEIWDHLQRLFQDNKGSRAATLESKFVNLKFIDCNDIDDYYDKLKALANRLSDLDFPMNDQRLVIELVNGLPEEYNTVASFIQQSMPLFDAARSQLRTEEIRRQQQSHSSSHTALAATNTSSPDHSRQRGTPAAQPSFITQQRPFSPDAQPSLPMGRQAPLLPTPAGPSFTTQQAQVSITRLVTATGL